MDTDASPIKESSHRSSVLTRFTSMAVISLCSLLILSTVVYWGGTIQDFAVWLYPAGALLWLLILAFTVRNISRKVVGGGLPEVIVLLWLVYAGVSYFSSPAEYAARFEWLWILTYAAVFVSLRNLVHNQKWFLIPLCVLIVAATFSCIFALGHRGDAEYAIWGQMRPNYGPRISGTFGCPNHFGNLMVQSALAVLGLSFYSRIKWSARILFFYLFAMFSVGIYFSYSRGSVLAWTAGLLVTVYLFLRDKQRQLHTKLIVVVVLLLLMGGAVFAVAKNEYALSRVQQALTGDCRVQLAQDAIRIWQDHKLWGSGMATFDFIHQRVHQVGFVSGRAIYTHNDYLNLLSDYGLAGFVIVLSFFAILLLRMYRRITAAPDTELEVVLGHIGLTVFAAMAVHTMVDFNFHVPACALVFFMLMAAGNSQLKRAKARSLTGKSMNLILATCSAAICIMMLVLTWKTISGMTFFAKSEADILAMNTESIVAEAEKLYRADPKATELLEKAGDALRVKTAEYNASIKRSRRENDEETAQVFIQEREKTGQMALKYYSSAAASNPLYDSILIKQGMTLDILQRYDEAYMHYNQAMQNQPCNLYFKYHYGFHLVAAGEYELARTQFKAATHLRARDGTEEDICKLARQALAALPPPPQTAPPVVNPPTE